MIMCYVITQAEMFTESLLQMRVNGVEYFSGIMYLVCVYIQIKCHMT